MFASSERRAPLSSSKQVMRPRRRLDYTITITPLKEHCVQVPPKLSSGARLGRPFQIELPKKRRIPGIRQLKSPCRGPQLISVLLQDGHLMSPGLAKIEPKTSQWSLRSLNASMLSRACEWRCGRRPNSPPPGLASPDAGSRKLESAKPN